MQWAWWDAILWKKSYTNRDSGIAIFGQATTTNISSMRHF